MNLTTQLSEDKDLKKYIDFFQETYSDTYADSSVGLTKQHFSKEVFSSPRIVEYCKQTLKNREKQKVWLTFDGEKLVGSITIEEIGNECELKGFYVATSHQGKGIGKALWEKAKDFAGNKDIFLDTYSHNKKAIDIYLKWGFIIDETKAKFFRSWPEWPKGFKAECIYMRYKSH